MEAKAKTQIGKISSFEAKQTFQYKDENDNLPFFPLLHSEQVTIANQSLNVDTAKAYNIYLSEDDKVQLTEMIFDYIEKNEMNKGLSSSLLYPLTKFYPEFNDNFKIYVSKLLMLFNELEEENVVTDGFSFSYNLNILAAGINKMTQQYPQVYAFKLVDLVVAHPSLLNTSGSFPNISAQDLENVVDQIEKQLQAGTMNPNVKMAYKKPLMYITHNYIPGGQLGNLASKYADEKAALILKTYYTQD